MSAQIIHVRALQDALKTFTLERGWQPYNSPKNLVSALSVEAAELLEHFVWLSPEESYRVMQDDTRAQGVRDELADVFNLLLQIADALEVDLEGAALEKMAKNAVKYPLEDRPENGKTQ